MLSASRNREGARRLGLAHRRCRRRTPTDIDDVLRDASRKREPLPPAFVVELLQWLRDQPSTAGAGVAGACIARSKRRATRPT